MYLIKISYIYNIMLFFNLFLFFWDFPIILYFIIYKCYDSYLFFFVFTAIILITFTDAYNLACIIIIVIIILSEDLEEADPQTIYRITKFCIS